ncbi:MAG TPA: signal peptidase I, partial [Chloroflexota bacterium]|nr:signal peptidase I [Chloroflexota bacterium]
PGGPWPWLCSRRLLVVGGSMYPLLQAGDVLLVDRLAYADDPIQRGDVVAFRHASAPSGRMVKLVAGLPDEQVEMRRDRLWINDRELIYPRAIVGSMPGQWTLEADEFFVLSIAVAVGTDSRTFGPLKSEAVLGRVWFILPPSPRNGRLPRTPLALREDKE